MKVLFATAEALPYWKTGGLADVARALPDALVARGHDVCIVLPYYRHMRRLGLELQSAGSSWTTIAGRRFRLRYLMHRPATGAPAILVDQPELFDVTDPYDSSGAEHGPLLLAHRFACLSGAIAERARHWPADMVHLNDWQTGMAAAYIRRDQVQVPTIYTIHNLAYQGNFPAHILPEIGIPWPFFHLNGVEFHGQASFLKAGLALSDRIVTVSPTYAREIQTHAFGAGMDGLLRFRRDVLKGILNGIDTRTWNPANDRWIPVQYEASSLQRKEENRRQLFSELKLDPRGPLAVIVSRLAHQKGIDIVMAALEGMLKLGIRLAVLGDGDAGIQESLSRAAERYPRRVKALSRFDETLAHRFYAGGDLFLIPSRFEPCGLGQMIAQRYGTPPVARLTGGLADTVEDGKTGFCFASPTAESMLSALARARRAWRGPEWLDIQERCMALDRSWEDSARYYEELYLAAIRRGAAPAEAFSASMSDGASPSLHDSRANTVVPVP